MSPAPLGRVADFQAAWYLALLCSAMIALTAYATWSVVRALRPMWRGGDRGMAAVIAAVSLVVVALFVSMLATVAATLVPPALPGGG